MSTEVTLPALGESVTEGTVTRWLKEVGEEVEVDEPLLEVSTDKVDTEIPSPVAGTLLEIKFQEDDVAEVGAVLAIIGDAGESGGDDAPAEEAPAAEEPEAAAEEEPVETAAPQDEPKQESAPSAAAASSGIEVTLPALGESVTEGTVTRWLKQVGDTVEVDEPLLEVSTDKVDTEIPSPAAGTLLEIRFKEDDVAEVGAVLAIIGDASAQPEPQEETAPEAPTEQPTPAEPKEEPKPEPKMSRRRPQ